MSLPAAQHRFSADDFLVWEAGQERKHEYLDGEVFAMAGASDAHVTIAGNLFIALRTHLRSGPCSVYISDMKLHAAADNAFFYPDVFVTCSQTDRAQNLTKGEPSLIAEVLSPGTAAYDRGQKFAAYRRFPTLREYLLVDSERVAVELFRRDEDSNLWVLHPFAADEQVTLSSVGLTLPVSALYEDVQLERGGASTAQVNAPADQAGHAARSG